MAADPRVLFYVTAVTLGALALWVAWALARTPSRSDLTPVADGPVTKPSAKTAAADDAATEDDD